jgi:hypothetical protein
VRGAEVPLQHPRARGRGGQLRVVAPAKEEHEADEAGDRQQHPDRDDGDARQG